MKKLLKTTRGDSLLDIEAIDIVYLQTKRNRIYVVTDQQVFAITSPAPNQVARLLACKKIYQVHKNYWVALRRVVWVNVQNRYLLLHRRFADQSALFQIPFNSLHYPLPMKIFLNKGCGGNLLPISKSGLLLNLILQPPLN